MKTYTEFLQYLHGDISNSIIRVPLTIKGSKKTPFKTINITDISDLLELTDIYFQANIGGTKNKDIHTLPSIIIDLDAGKDNGKYKSERDVNIYKKAMMMLINSFDLPPSIIVETRNGYQIYWKLSSSPTVDRWIDVENKMISKFEADESVNKPSQMMRLPYTKWLKPKHGLPPFDVRIERFEDLQYTIEDFEAVLKDIDVPEKSYRPIRQGQRSTLSLTPEGGNSMTKSIEWNDIEYLQSVLQPSGTSFQTFQDFYAHITQVIDLGALLGVQQGGHCCVFHDDTNPSGDLFRSVTGEWIYKCHSDECGVSYNILGCIRHLKGYSRHEAIQFIKKIYRLEIEESEWHQAQVAGLIERKDFIENDLEALYPQVYKNVKRDLLVLQAVIRAAQDRALSDTYTDIEGNLVFFVSLRFLTRFLSSKRERTVGQKIANLAFHRLLHKVDEAQVPQKLLDRAKKIAKRKGQDFHVSFYSLPAYTAENLKLSEERANQAKERPVAAKNRSYEGYRRTFGQSIANEVYPQMRNQQLSWNAIKRTERIHQIVLETIEDQGFIRESELVLRMWDEFGSRGKKQVALSRNELLDSYGLQRIRLTKKLKEAYGIDSDGNGYIIVPGVELAEVKDLAGETILEVLEESFIE